MTRLAKLRVDKNLTQTELALKIGVTQQAVSQWESGKKLPKSRYVKKLALALAVTTDEVLDSFNTAV